MIYIIPVLAFIYAIRISSSILIQNCGILWPEKKIVGFQSDKK